MVALRVEAEHDFGARRFFDPQALGADGHTAIRQSRASIVTSSSDGSPKILYRAGRFVNAGVARYFKRGRSARHQCPGPGNQRAMAVTEHEET